jgi:polysaccharide pyruvyl transferase WcaK-like protein
MLQEIKMLKPDAEVTVSSFNPQQTQTFHHCITIPSVHSLAVQNGLCGYKGAVLIGVSKIDTKEWLQDYAEVLSSADVFIQAGGGYFNQKWIGAYPARLLELQLCQTLQIPYSIVGQTLGPFRNFYLIEQVRRALKHTKYVAVRDRASREFIRNLGLDADLCADLATMLRFTQPVVEAKTGRVATFVVRRSRRFISPGRDYLLFRYSALLRTLATVIDKLVGRGFEVNLTSATIGHDALNACNKVYSLRGKSADDNPSVKALQNLTDFTTTLLYSDLVVSMNMHPLILASQAGVPVVGLSYHFKVNDFMNRAGLENFLLDLRDSISVEQLMDTIHSALNKAPAGDQFASLANSAHICLERALL